MKLSTINLDFTELQVMAILNVTPDSFFADSRAVQAKSVEERVLSALAGGCSIVDVGGYSSRPGADEVSPDEEWRRVRLGVGTVRRLAPEMPVSVDTFRSEIAENTIKEFGDIIINDISAGELDRMLPTVAARYDLPYIAMHMRGTSATMNTLADYRDIVGEVVSYFETKIIWLKELGVRRIIFDPGFGFAKSAEQNFELLRGLHSLSELGCPLLAGVSRKSMIYRTLDTTPEQALAGTVALGWECLRQGATILRVHDVQEAADTIKLFKMFRG